MAVDQSPIPGSRRRKKSKQLSHNLILGANINSGPRHEQKADALHDQPPLKQVKSSRQHRSDSPVRILYLLVESVIARIEVLERSDEEPADSERLYPIWSNQASDGDAIQRLNEMVKAVLERVLILEERRDIDYQCAYRAKKGTECIVRGCGAKQSSKNALRHMNDTKTPEHEVAGIILRQKSCWQCGMDWKSPNGLATHEAATHNQSSLSRMGTFQPFLQQPLSKCLSLVASKLWFKVLQNV